MRHGDFLSWGEVDDPSCQPRVFGRTPRCGAGFLTNQSISGHERKIELILPVCRDLDRKMRISLRLHNAAGRLVSLVPLFCHSPVLGPPSATITTFVQDSQIPTIIHNPNALMARLLKGSADLVLSSPQTAARHLRLVNWSDGESRQNLRFFAVPNAMERRIWTLEPHSCGLGRSPANSAWWQSGPCSVHSDCWFDGR